MADVALKIREIAKSLLDAEKVDVVIGFKKGTLPVMSEPTIIRKASDTETLIWDATCRLNLCN
ncbi:MAG: 4Fe-4S ferredoxin, partial [Desulfobotulus sp.]|nr:4Fe-4S ferredoxin [Desulfobotulus sp.]